MALVEGGKFICYIHGYNTASVNEWNKHCTDIEGHTESGTTQCIICSSPIQFDNLPFHPVRADGSKGINLRCENCESKTVGNAVIRRIVKEVSVSKQK